MAHDAAGRGEDLRPRLVLLHSGVTDRRMWDPQWARLSARFEVTRVDLPGFGETPMPAGRFSYGSEVAALVRQLEIAPVVLVGSSFGGRVALEVAGGCPEIISALVLLAPAAGGYAPTADLRAFGAEEDRLLEAGDIDAAVELNIRTWIQPSVAPPLVDLVRDGQRRAFDLQLAADASPTPPEVEWADPDVSGITAPTLIVSGGQDFDYFQDIADDLAGRMPAARHVRLDWAGHLPSLERPDEITDLLLEFVEGLGRVERS